MTDPFNPLISIDPFGPDIDTFSPFQDYRKSYLSEILFCNQTHSFNAEIRRKIFLIEQELDRYLSAYTKSKNKKNAFIMVLKLLKIRQLHSTIYYLQFLLSEKWFVKVYFSRTSDAKELATKFLTNLKLMLNQEGMLNYFPFKHYPKRKIIDHNELSFFKIFILSVINNKNNFLALNNIVFCQLWFNLFLIRQNAVMENHWGLQYGSFDGNTYGPFYKKLLSMCNMRERNALKNFAKHIERLNAYTFLKALKPQLIIRLKNMCDDEDYADWLKAGISNLQHLI